MQHLGRSGQEGYHGLDDTENSGSPPQDLKRPAKKTRELLELIKEEPAEMGDRTTYRAVSPKRTPFQIRTSH
jgi:hypothetical protein